MASAGQVMEPLSAAHCLLFIAGVQVGQLLLL